MDRTLQDKYTTLLKDAVTDRFTRDQYFMKQFYPKYRTDNYQVYWINDNTHKSLEDGYIGVAPLCLRNIKQRYEIEMWYYLNIGDEGVGRVNLMKKLVAAKEKICYNVLYANLKKEKALAYERFLRPFHNYLGEDHNEACWNIRRGGG